MGLGYISSRIGMKRKAYPIGDDTDIFGYIANMDPRPYCVLVDEAQFLPVRMSMIWHELLMS